MRIFDIACLHDFIKNFSKDMIAKVPNKNKMNAMCERLDKGKTYYAIVHSVSSQELLSAVCLSLLSLLS